MHTQPVSEPTAQSAGQYEPSAILRWLYRRFFPHILVDESWSGRVREAARQGVVVYVMRSLSLLDFLCLDFLVKRFGLPVLRFVNYLGIFGPSFKRGGSLFSKREADDRALPKVVEEGFSALLFLRRPPRLGIPTRKGSDLEEDLIATLVRCQRTMDRPILLVPQTFVWSLRPEQRQTGLADILFGPVHWPGRVRVFLQFLFNYRNARLRSGEPFDLGSFVAQHADLDDTAIADKIRYALLRRIERERRLLVGPTKKTVGRIQEELLHAPRVRRHIEREAKASNRSTAKVEASARKELQRLCAGQTPFMLAFFNRGLDWIWHRIYDGIIVDGDGIDRLREAMRDGAVVLLPSHKSHVDYLVLSTVLYSHSLSPPLIAAGENLSFWPVGWFLRRGGAFFIKRSFKGKKLYAALVDAYMRKLLVEGFPIEFFIEGGRSRTGKILPPKYGLLSMIVDAALKLRARRIYFVPISIGYERVIEERSFVHELSGGEKEKENVANLLRSSKVLRSRYGRLYVQIGEILSFDELRDEALAQAPQKDGSIPKEPAPRQRRAMIQGLAHRVVHQINQVTVVTPAALVATALLVHRRRGMTQSQLLTTAGRLVDVLERAGARMAPTLLKEDETLREDTLAEAVRLFIDARLIVQHETGDQAIYTIADERRMALEYYKNNILQFFVAAAMISAALDNEAASIDLDALRGRVRELSRLFKYEFMYRADASFDEIFDDMLTSMVEAGWLRREGEVVVCPDGEQRWMVRTLSRMLRTYFESYRLAVRSVQLLSDDGVGRKEWLKKTMALGQRMYLAGEIELRESISKPKIESALQAMHDLDLVRLRADRIEPAKDATEREGLVELERSLGAHLERSY